MLLNALKCTRHFPIHNNSSHKVPRKSVLKEDKVAMGTTWQRLPTKIKPRSFKGATNLVICIHIQLCSYVPVTWHLEPFFTHSTVWDEWSYWNKLELANWYSVGKSFVGIDTWLTTTLVNHSESKYSTSLHWGAESQPRALPQEKIVSILYFCVSVTFNPDVY